jgi:GNAT superfamily N-acetyltransferase
MPEMAPDLRTADASDLDGLVTTLTAAFEGDPVWRWVFPDVDGLRVFWRFFIGNCLRFPCTQISGEYAAAAVWVPPGQDELSEEGEARVEDLLGELLGPRTPDVLELLDRFEAIRPSEPHYYLSLLGIDPAHRGEGLGMGLLAKSLEAKDAEGVPSYLESTNPVNNKRYARLGYQQVGEFTTPDGAHPVATMWRAVPS